MAQGHVELVLSGIEALNRRDLHGAMAPFHEDIEFLDAGTGLRHSGRAAIRRYLTEFLSSYASYAETPEESIDLGDRVVLLLRTTATGEGSGVPVDVCHGEIHDIRDDLVARVTIYPTYDETLKAAGVESRLADRPAG